MASDDTHRIAERYTRALFALAVAEGALDALEKDLHDFLALNRETPALSQLITNPLISGEQKAAILDKILAKAKAAPLTGKFIHTLALNNRLTALPEMVREFDARLAAYRGETIAELTSAAALSDAGLRQVSDALAKALGKKLKIVARVNPLLIGGLTVRIGDTLIDDSIKNKLSRLRYVLKAKAA